MKKNIFTRNFKLAGLLSLVLLASCKKDELESRELLVFLQPDKPGLATKTQIVPFVHNPVAITGNRIVEVAAAASREVPAEIKVTITPDTKLIPAYNLLNKTAALELPATAYQVTNGNTHTISAGSVKSDPIKIEITHPELLTSTAGYLLPLTITSIETKDKGVTTSSTHATVYLLVTYEYNNVATTEIPLTGTLMSRTGWSTTVSNTTSGALGPAMIDGNNTTSWRSSNSTTAVKWAIINMGSVQTIKGFQIVPNYVAVAENATRMTVSTSTDNVTWTVQGTWNGSGPAATSSATAPDIKGVNFVAPVAAQYFRFDITALVSGGRVGFGEVNAIQ